MRKLVTKVLVRLFDYEYQKRPDIAELERKFTRAEKRTQRLMENTKFAHQQSREIHVDLLGIHMPKKC